MVPSHEDVPVAWTVYLVSFYHTLGHYPGQHVGFPRTLVSQALGLPRNSTVSPYGVYRKGPHIKQVPTTGSSRNGPRSDLGT